MASLTDNWLTKLAEEPKSDEQSLYESIGQYNVPDLIELAWEFNPSLRPTYIDNMQTKIAAYENMGREVAKERFEKIAIIGPLLAGAARLAGGQALKGAAVGVAKDMAGSAVLGGATKAISNAAKSPSMAGAGFNYGKVAGVMPPAGLLQRATGYMVRNPGTAITAAGAIGGAALAPTDPQTGQKHYVQGALMGGGLAAGANALSGDAMGNKLRHAVLNKQSPILGQKVKAYASDATRATKGYYAKPPTEAVKTASPAGLILQAAFRDKIANQQTLTYDPSTKTFTRQHLSPSSGGDAVQATGASSINAGHMEPVRNNVSHAGFEPYGSKGYLQARTQKALTPPSGIATMARGTGPSRLGAAASALRR